MITGHSSHVQAICKQSLLSDSFSNDLRECVGWRVADGRVSYDNETLRNADECDDYTRSASPFNISVHLSTETLIIACARKRTRRRRQAEYWTHTLIPITHVGRSRYYGMCAGRLSSRADAHEPLPATWPASSGAMNVRQQSGIFISSNPESKIRKPNDDRGSTTTVQCTHKYCNDNVTTSFTVEETRRHFNAKIGLRRISSSFSRLRQRESRAEVVEIQSTSKRPKSKAWNPEAKIRPREVIKIQCETPESKVVVSGIQSNTEIQNPEGYL